MPSLKNQSILRPITISITFLSLVCSGFVFAQFWGGETRTPPSSPKLKEFPKHKFTFCTLAYQNNGKYEPLGFGWNTDYPDSGHNFMLRLEELTTIEINKDKYGEPIQEVISLTDEALFDYPYMLMSDVGRTTLEPEEQDRLREYLLRGGFLHVDDFWGNKAWENWEYEISQVLDPDEYPITDIPLDHELFHIVFDVKEVPQVPSIQFWRQSRGSDTSERGAESAEPHFKGIFDKDDDKRLMVLMTHNTDIADGWEKEREDHEYFTRFSVKKSYPIGINIVVYALTH
jgi:hypothetical protein